MWMSLAMICIDFSLEFLYSSTICSNSSWSSFMALLYFSKELERTKTSLSMSVLLLIISFNTKSSSFESSFSCSKRNIFSHMYWIFIKLQPFCYVNSYLYAQYTILQLKQLVTQVQTDYTLVFEAIILWAYFIILHLMKNYFLHVSDHIFDLDWPDQRLTEQLLVMLRLFYTHPRGNDTLLFVHGVKHLQCQ